MSFSYSSEVIFLLLFLVALSELSLEAEVGKKFFYIEGLGGRAEAKSLLVGLVNDEASIANKVFLYNKFNYFN